MPQYAKGQMMAYAGIENHIVLATTNSVVTARGLVMGGGAAKDVVFRWPEAPMVLGVEIRRLGDPYYLILEKEYGAFQTKYHWKEDSDLTLVMGSLIVLGSAAAERPEATFHLPFPGIGLGGLNKSDVKRVIDDVKLPYNVIIWSK